MSGIRILPMKIVKARRLRMCDHCGNMIEVGEKHELHTGFDPNRMKIGAFKWGAWVSERRHIACPGQS